MLGTFDEAQKMIRKAAAGGINDFADGVAADSELEVPVKLGDLKASALYPGNDPASRCDPENLTDGAMVSYNTVYAAAQHEGEALQHRMHPVVPITKHGVVVGFFTDVTRIYEHEVEWVVEHYTEPQTKSHFLSDPLKNKTPQLERFIGLNIAKVLK